MKKKCDNERRVREREREGKRTSEEKGNECEQRREKSDNERGEKNTNEGKNLKNMNERVNRGT